MMSFASFRSIRWAAAGVVMFAGLSTAQAAYRNLVGFDDLQTYLGAANVPTGATIQVMQVEAPDLTGQYMPNYGTGDLTAKFFTNVTNTNIGVSGHANTVATNLDGNNTSIAPGIGSLSAYPILNYEANSFISSVLKTSGLPDSTSARVVNHSWVGKVTDVGGNLTDAYLLRLDYTVANDNLIQVAGLPNNNTLDAANQNLWRDSYNAITVGRTDAGHYIGYTAANTGSGIYTAGRVVPTLVAPSSATSYSTPMISAAASLLLDAAQSNPAWSNASYSTGRSPNVHSITNAESSEVVKALLMAGADRYSNQPGAVLTNYTADTANGLDHRYGAGQLNIYNSYRILQGQEQDSTQDGNANQIANFGWDYDNHFGGASDSNSTASYFFDASDTNTLIASLVWNLNVFDALPGPIVGLNGTLYNLDLALIDLTTPATVALSDSTLDNTENIWYSGLIPGHSYELRVSANGTAFDFDYGLAWQIVPEPASLALLCLGSLSLLRRRHAVPNRTA